MMESLSYNSELAAVLESIHGIEIETKLNKLAEFAKGGRIGNGGTRLTLSVEEKAAREYLNSEMRNAGMQVEDHPLGLIGTYYGLRIGFPAVGIGSHFDSVPQGGKYDGAVGTVTSIEIVKAFNKAGIRLQRPLKVFAFTGEESSRFNTALFGSRGIFIGLDDDTLDLKDREGIQMRHALAGLGFDPEVVKEPKITPDDISSFIELHVEQGPRLEQNGLDIAVISSIAAPDRRRIIIGDLHETIPLEFITDSYSTGLEISITGKAGHSGSTPMGKEYRADGLHIAGDLLCVVPAAFEKLFRAKGVRMNIGKVAVEGAALNKIPGRISIALFFSGENTENVNAARQFMAAYINKLNKYYGSDKYPSFKSNPIFFADLEVSKDQPVFNAVRILPSFQAAGRIIKWVDRICSIHSGNNIVGTIGTFETDFDGRIELKLDLRGMDKNIRDQVLEKIRYKIRRIGQAVNVNISVSDPLPGSGDPTQMDAMVQGQLFGAAVDLGYKVELINSHAGHDTQNAVRAGIRGGMIFIPSRNGGKAHVPEEYSSSEDLEKGAKVLVSVLYHLASKTD